MSTQSIPDGFRTVTPHLVVKGAAQAIDFYKQAFGAEELNRHEMGGAIMHASLRIGDSIVMLNDEFPSAPPAPSKDHPSPVTIHLYVEDVDELYAKAQSAGAEVVMPLDDTFWGDRYAVLRDPYGHSWSIATHIEDVAPEDVEKRAAAAFGGQS